MTYAQDKHLEMILGLIREKYVAGADAHKDTDPLMNMSIKDMVDNALAESVDKVVYIASMKDHVGEMVEAMILLNELISRSQAILAMCVGEGGSLKDKQAIEGLLEILDSPDQRHAQGLVRSLLKI